MILTVLVDTISLRTTREVAPPAYNWLSAPLSQVTASGSTLVDNRLRARVHPHHSFSCVCVLCVCTNSGCHSTHSAAAICALRLSSSREVDGRFTVHISKSLRTCSCDPSCISIAMHSSIANHIIPVGTYHKHYPSYLENIRPAHTQTTRSI